MILYPPVIFVPASFAQSSNPLIISLVTTSLACSDISILIPNTINIWSTGLETPIAYTSESTLQQAILPYMYGSSTSG